MQTTKEHIIRTGLILFLQKSYRDVTMKEIVKASGLSKGAFYHYFDSKEALFKEIAQGFFNLGKTDYQSLPSESFNAFYSGYARQIGISFNEMYSLNDDAGEESSAFNFFFILFEAIKRFPVFAQLERELYQRDLDSWIKVIKKARSDKEINASATDEEIAALFLSVTDGVFIQLIASNLTKDFYDVIIKKFNIIYQGLKS